MRCRYCKSTTLIKHGKRRTSQGEVQIYKCKSCSRYFSENTTYEKVKLREFAIKASTNLHSSGLSYRTIQRHLEIVYGIKVSHVAVYCWVRPYALSRLLPAASNTRRAIPQTLEIFESIPDGVTVIGKSHTNIYDRGIHMFINKLYDVVLGIEKIQDVGFEEFYKIGVIQSIVMDVRPGFSRFKMDRSGRLVEV